MNDEYFSKKTDYLPDRKLPLIKAIFPIFSNSTTSSTSNRSIRPIKSTNSLIKQSRNGTPTSITARGKTEV